MPEFVWDFEVPEFGVKRLAIAPCPHCAPDTPKYKKGVIAYFADEQVIRLMGTDCFAAMNPEAHAESLRNMRANKKAVKDERYLRSQLPKLNDIIISAQHSYGVAKAVDKVQEQIRSSYNLIALQKLWDATKGGEYRVLVEADENVTDTSGNTRTARRERFDRYGSAPSMALFDPASAPLAPRVKRVSDRLEALRQRMSAEPNLAFIPAKTRGEMVRTFGSAFQELKNLMASVESRRRILRPAEIATLRAWGARDNAEAKAFVDFSGNVLRLGRESLGAAQIQCGSAIYSVLPTLPAIADV
jgi:hypothetical protein